MSEGAPRPTRRRRGRSLDRGAVYRLSRMVHGYLSAAAFLALIFFAATGLLLDHPDWLQGKPPAMRQARAALPAAEVSAALGSPDSDRALAAAAGRRMRLLGAYKDASRDGDLHLIRLEGARGVTDLTVDGRTGEAESQVQAASVVNVVEELHRGRASGAAWRWVIDLSAMTILLLSLVGYVLFFSLRFRLRTSLILTGASLALMAAVYVLAVP